MLAEKYVHAKHRAVKTINQQSELADLPKWQKTVLKCLFALNITIPVLFYFMLYFDERYILNHGNQSKVFAIATAIYLLLNGVLLVISGIILVTTVFAIRSFYRQRNAADAIDTSALARHSTAFALFMVASFVTNLAVAASLVFPNNP